MEWQKLEGTWKGGKQWSHLTTLWRRLQDLLVAIFAIIAWDSVSNLTVLAALENMGDGSARYVRTLRATFILDTSSLLAPDGITVVAAIGGGNWIRQVQSDPYWTTQATWYVNPTTGDDENTGLTTGTALATLSEWSRRVNNLTIEQTTTVWIEEDVAATDILSVNVTLVPEAELHIEGVPNLELEALISDWVPRNQAANIPGQIELTGWTAATHVGRLLTFTDGPAVGLWSWVARDAGGGLANISTPVNFFNPVAYPAIGNTARIYTVPRIRVNTLRIDANRPTAWVDPVQFKNVGFLSGALYDCFINTPNARFDNCWFGGGLEQFSGLTWNLFNCSGAFSYVNATMAVSGGVFTGAVVNRGGNLGMQKQVMFDAEFPAPGVAFPGLYIDSGTAWSEETVWFFGTLIAAVIITDGGNASFRVLCGDIVGTGVHMFANSSMGLDNPSSSFLNTTTGDIRFQFASTAGDLVLTFAQVPYTSYHTWSRVYAHDMSQENQAGSVPATVRAGKKGALTPGSVAPGVFVLADLTESATELPQISIQNAFLGNLRANLGTAPGVGETVTVVVYVNSVATALTCAMTGAAPDPAATSAIDFTHRVPVVPGDRVSVRIITTNVGAPFAAANLSVNMEMA